MTKFVYIFNLLDFPWYDGKGWPCGSLSCGSYSTSIGLTQEDVDKLKEILPDSFKDGKLQNSPVVVACVLANGLGFFPCPRHESGHAFPPKRERKLPKRDLYPARLERIGEIVIELPPDKRTCEVRLSPLPFSRSSEDRKISVDMNNILQAIAALEVAPKLIDEKPMPFGKTANEIGSTYWEYYLPIGSGCNLHLCSWKNKDWCELTTGTTENRFWKSLKMKPKEVEPVKAALYSAVEIMKEAPDWTHLEPAVIAPFTIDMIPPGPSYFLSCGLIDRVVMSLRKIVDLRIHRTFNESQWNEVEKIVEPLKKAGICFGTREIFPTSDEEDYLPEGIEHRRHQPEAVRIVHAVIARDLEWLAINAWADDDR